MFINAHYFTLNVFNHGPLGLAVKCLAPRSFAELIQRNLQIVRFGRHVQTGQCNRGCIMRQVDWLV